MPPIRKKIVKKAKAAAATSKESGEAAKYRRSGSTGGTAQSTVKGRVSAMYHFNQFLETKQMSPFDQLKEEELCCIALFQEYGTYLSEFARKRRKVQDTDTSDVGSKRMRLGADTHILSGFAAASTVHSSGSESAALITSVQHPKSAFAALKQAKKVVQFNGTQALSTVFQLWYENKFVNDERYVGWTGSVSRDKTLVSNAIRYLESIWPDGLRDVLQAAAPARTAPDYVHYNTTLKAAATDATTAVTAAIASASKRIKKFHAKVSLNAVYSALVENTLLVPPKK